MTIKFGANTDALSAFQRLNETTSALAKVTERLSSGQRINSASDDAAGLSIATSLSVNSRVYGQAIRNLNDGVSVLSVADSAVQSLSQIVTRQLELATEAANGSYSNTQRQALDKEAQALRQEFNRVIDTTQMNGVSLLNGNALDLTLQAGIGSNSVLSIALGRELGASAGTATISQNLNLQSTVQQIVNFDFTSRQDTPLIVTLPGSASYGGYGGVNEVSQIDIASNVHGSDLAGKEFSFDVTGSSYYVWFNDGSNVDPGDLTGQGRSGIEVAVNDSDDNVALETDILNGMYGAGYGDSQGSGTGQVIITGYGTDNVQDIGSAINQTPLTLSTTTQGGAPSQINAGSYFEFQGQNGNNIYAWFAVDGGVGTGDPGLAGTYTGIRVDLSSSDDAATIAAKTAAALHGVTYGGTIQVINGDQIEFTDIDGGTVIDNNINGISWTNPSNTTNRFLSGTSFTVYDDTNTARRFWFNVDGEGGIAGGTEIDINSTDDINQALQKIVAATPGAYFTASQVGDSIRFTNVTGGTANAPSAGTSGGTASTVQAGSTSNNVNIASDTLTATAHGLSTGTQITVSGSSLPGGLSAGTYYVIKVDDNTIKFATSATNAQLGTAVDLTSAGSGTLGISYAGAATTIPYENSFDLTSQTQARSALTTLSGVMDGINLQIASIGATQSRVGVALQNLASLKVNDEAAAGRIMDADVASESAEYTRLSLLQQISTNLISKISLEPQIALELLK